MTELTLTIEDESLVPSLRHVLRSLPGVKIKPTPRRRKKSGIEQALDDEAAGRVTEWKSAEQMFETLMASE